MIKAKKSLTRSDIYTSLCDASLSEISASIPNEIKHELSEFLSTLHPIVAYMLDDRFKPEKAKKKRKAPLKRRPLSQDMAVFLYGDEGIKKGKIPLTSPLDIVKLFKVLENFILSRKYMADIEDFSLGQFKDQSVVLVNSLPKLLLGVDSITDLKTKERLLSLIFSSVIIYRQFRVKSTPDVSTVTAVYSGQKTIADLLAKEYSQNRVSEWVKTLDLSTVKEYSKLSMYSGNASSPNGGASGPNMFKDVAAIAADPSLFDAILALSSHFKGSTEFHLLVETLAANVAIDKEFSKGAIHSRLFHFTAAGGKARIIANVDWVTQTALSGIHFALFQLLSTLRSDATFDHKSGMKLVDNSNSSYFSVDLSAATDRMPRHLQASLISSIWTAMGYNGPAIAKNWLKVVDREYSCEKSGMNNSQPIRYSVGQGMGLFSSWVAMSITHHYIVNSLVGIPQERYRLVGDDLLIKGTQEEFDCYVSAMSDIGVTVNQSKTISSYAPSAPTVEFARNYIIDGLPIRCFPFGCLFAWTEGQCSFETAIAAMPGYMVQPSIRHLTVLSTVQAIELVYFMWDKLGIPWAEIELITSYPDYDKVLNEDTFIKVRQIMSKKYVPSEASPRTKGYNFLDTLKSQCTMRQVSDLVKSKDISDAILLLSFADDNLIDASNEIHNRLVNAYLISYDLENLGSPLLSKRERTILKDVFSHFYKGKNKKIVAETQSD